MGAKQSKKKININAEGAMRRTKKVSRKKQPLVWRKKYAIPALLAVIILFVIWWFGLGGSTLSVRLGMDSYLEGKYDTSFVIGRPHIKGSGLGVAGSYRAEAYPVDDPTLKFEVGRLQDEERYFDYYTGALWAREERPRVEALLSGLYPSSTPEFDLRTHITSAQTPGPISGAVPSIDDAISQYSKEFFYSLTVKFTEDPLSELEKEDFRLKFREVNDFVKGRGATLYSLRFAFNYTDGTYSYCDNASYDSVGMETALTTCLEDQKKGRIW